MMELVIPATVSPVRLSRARICFPSLLQGLDADGIPQYLIDGKLTTTGVNFQEREKLDYLKYEGPTDPTSQDVSVTYSLTKASN